MENNYQKETKKPQQILKLAKLNNSYQEPEDEYEPKRRAKNQIVITNDDSTTFNGLEYFKKESSDESAVKIESFLEKKKIISSIMSKDSLRDRYQNLHLITSIENMLMFKKYSNLCQYFKEIDEMLLYLQNTQKPPFLNTIQEQLSQNSKIKVSLSIIQQILEIFPNAYKVSWTRNEKLIRIDRSDLLLETNFKSHIQLSERLQSFKQKLFDYIQTNGEQIGEAALPKNELDIEKKTIKNEIQENLIKQIQAVPPKHEIKLLVSKVPTLSKVSQELIEKLKQKKKIEIPQTEHQAPKKQLIALASLLHQYYIIRDVSNMFLQNVIKYSVDGLKQHLLNDIQVKNHIELLTKVCPQWIKLVENQSGMIVRINREIDLPSIIKAIDQM